MAQEINSNPRGIFNGLTEVEVEGLTKNLTRVKMTQDEDILAENEMGDNLYFICKGRVEIHKSTDNHTMPLTQLSILEPGDFFGEMSIIEEQPRCAGVRALEDVELLVIPKETFETMAITHPIIMFNLMKTISGRLRDTNVKFVELMNNMISESRLMAIGMAASKIIHDIKTPLTVIVLTAQLIESIFPDSKEFTDSLIKQTKLVDQMVREILDYAKGHDSVPFLQQIDLDAFLKDIKETYGHALQGRNVVMRIASTVKEPVSFDESKIRRVLLNLIKNASEAIPDSGNILINARVQSGWLQISVIDDGPGIPEHIKDNLFSPFVTDGKPHGTGLGLAICQKLVNEHKGRLEYLPVPDHGARFDIRIPQQEK
ncbi:MAG: histidine kinase [Candidatus Cloacimonetes bacterium HGW-Cloacimonetes-1]|jgi:signal transduction histidine kinase|nr:MAG: histidine kinase [Candidatus Cloacimonetes bacterium HGW-Cloacimonetes-1]